MYEIGIATQFEAAHRLTGDFGPATRLHGHTYRLEVVLRGERLANDGTLYDLGRLKQTVDAIAAELHFRDLADVPALAGHNTTAEAVAAYCWEQVAPTVAGQGLQSLLVRVWENQNAWAARDEPLAT
jgi:6-pyruvoyltetrahydropterin/6-carboxytetrahydropterin synthase